MKRQSKKLAGVLVALFVLAAVAGTAGGRLTLPERLTGEDQFVGFHLVYQPVLSKVESFQERYPCTEYGAQELKTKEGDTVTLRQKILIGVYNEETRRYEFPGLEGLNCFFDLQTEENGEQHYAVCADVADIHADMGEENNTLSGTVYFGPQLKEHEAPRYGYSLTAYRVYQMTDGTVYITGEGDRQGHAGEGFTITEEHSRLVTVNGKQQSITLKVGFSTARAERTEAVAVTWFDAKNGVLEDRILTMQEIGSGLTLERPAGAAWSLVAATDDRGTVIRSAYTLGGEAEATHPLIQLDERGLGTVVYLSL